MTGGGSNLLHLHKYCSKYLGKNVEKLGRIDKEENISLSDESFAACLGALKIIKDGWETEAIPESVSKNDDKISFFAKFFGNN